MCEGFSFYDLVYYFPGILFSWTIAFKVFINIKRSYPFEEFIIKKGSLEFKGKDAKIIALFMILCIISMLFFMPLMVFEIYKIKQLGC